MSSIGNIRRVRGRFRFTGIEFLTGSYQRVVLTDMAIIAQRHFKRGFRKQGGQTDASKQGWKVKHPKAKGNILVKRGNLRDDIKIIEVTNTYAKVGTTDFTSDYAMVHNEGDDTHNKNEFIGKSQSLDAEIHKMLKSKLSNLL